MGKEQKNLEELRGTIVEEIKVGNFVRLNDGTIGKYQINKNWINVVETNNKYIGFDIEKDILKHSSNIIDLIEIDDYVNGKLIHKIDKGTNYCYLYYGNCKTFVNYQIKSIVTHEQFSSIEYKVEEDK